MLIRERSWMPLVRNHLIRKDMKRKYCLVRLNGDLGVGSFVYVIWVGSSLRESTLLALVEEFCKDCGWYFKRWSREVDSALELRSKISRSDGTRCVKPYQMISLSIRECYEAIIDDSWASIEANHTMSPQETFMRFRLHPDFLRAMNVKQRTTSCPPSRRKYLSPRKSRAFYELTPAIVAIVLLIVLDQLVSTHILNHLF